MQVRDVLDRYVRMMTEQERALDAPERRNDLGTLLAWVLRRHGFQILIKPYRHVRTRIRKASGFRQNGVDILARCDVDGVPHLYRFVLKSGDFTRKDVGLGLRKGTMLHDLHLAASLRETLEECRAAQIDPDKCQVMIVAVHNGDMESDLKGWWLSKWKTKFLKDYEVTLDWWSADRIVDLLITPSLSGRGLGEENDVSIFPPACRAYVRSVVDSVRISEGSHIDMFALRHYTKTAMSTDGDEKQDRLLLRACSEMALVVHMIDLESRANAHGTCVPALSAIEHMICAILAHSSNQGGKKISMKALRESIGQLIVLYTEQASAFAQKLRGLQSHLYGLAMSGESEVIDYPLRTLRIISTLALAGLMSLEVGNKSEADSLADLCASLWCSNRGAASGPIADDNIIELSILWELWLKTDRVSVAVQTAAEVVVGFCQRMCQGYPLPTYSESASWPMMDSDVEALVGAYNGTPEGAHVVFSTSATLPLAVFVGWREAPVEISQLLFKLNEAADQRFDHKQQQPAWHTFAWVPPDEAVNQWYEKKIINAGVAEDFSLENIPSFVSLYAEFNTAIAPSIADKLGFPSLDRVAWRLHRTYPVLAHIVKLLEIVKWEQQAEASKNAASSANTSAKKTSAKKTSAKISTKKTSAKRTS